VTSDRYQFQSLKIFKPWRQFDTVDLEFHPRLTILTGANGSGKSTLLHILAGFFGWETKYVKTPGNSEIFNVPLSEMLDEFATIGSVTKSDSIVELKIPLNNNRTYHLDIGTKRLGSITRNSAFITRKDRITGVHIPARRPIQSAELIRRIPTQRQNSSSFLEAYVRSVAKYHERSSSQSPDYVLKEAILFLAMSAQSTETAEAVPDSKKLLDGFNEILRVVLPEKLGFRTLKARFPEIVMVTECGEFNLDNASGGFNAVIELVWVLYLLSLNRPDFVVTIDEPENHLHPLMQQRLLPCLLEAFPSAQFIIATHNPLIISSVADCSIYALRHNLVNRIYSSQIDISNKAHGTDEILREVLGLPFTLPLWADEILRRLTEKYSAAELTQVNLDLLRAELERLGMDDEVPKTISDVITEHRQHDSN
jgi:predicted ATPase